MNSRLILSFAVVLVVTLVGLVVGTAIGLSNTAKLERRVGNLEKENSQLKSTLSRISTDLGFDGHEDVYPLVRIMSIEQRLSAVEAEWQAIPVGTLLFVADASNPPGKKSDTAPIETVKQATLRKMDSLLGSNWLEADGVVRDARKFPELFTLYTGESELNGNFPLNKPESPRTFVRSRAFKAAD